MSGVLPRVHAVVAWVFVATIVVQVFLAGAAITQLGGSGTFASHIDFGYLMGVFALAVVVTAMLARTGRRSILIAVGLLVLYVVQTSLPYARDGMPFVAALHPVNAAVLFALAAWYAGSSWRAASVAA